MEVLYCIVGPSGIGKTTLEDNLKKEFYWLKSVTSYTTRPQRHENENCHIFVSQEEYDKLKMVAYTYFNGYDYGVTEELLDQCDLFVVDPNGIKKLKQNYDRPTIVVGLKADQNVCKERMRNRGDSIEVIQSRMANDKIMFDNYLDLCDIVIDANQSEEKVLADFIDKVIEFERTNIW